MDGILIINKPKGMSSFKSLSIVKRKLGINKVGHLGTLDPNASGVLVLLCGRATKLNEKLSGGTKVYQSVFTFGIETDTLDTEGKITAINKIIPTIEQINDGIKKLVGKIEIEIPKFSAVHINGKRAYDLARKGIDFVAPKKFVEILRFELLSILNEKEILVEIECQTGTYVRSLAKLLANKLGTIAIASEITRTRVGEFDISCARTLEEVELKDLILRSN